MPTKRRIASSGCPTDNMAPCKSQSSVRVLQQGIDTIVFNVYGQLREDVALCLEMAKEDAQASDDGRALAPLPDFAGSTPLMQAAGARYYEYRCVSEDLTVCIQRPGKSKRPAATIRVSPACLWRLGRGGEIAADLAEHYLRPLFEGEGYRVQVSEVDLATDFQGHALTEADMAGLVSRVRSVPVYPEGEVCGGLVQWGRRGVLHSIAVGKSSVLRLSLYDKTRDSVQKGKTWFLDLWERQKGYVAGEAVWRSEFQFGREFLRELERPVETLDDLLVQLPAMWAYAVRWASFREVNPNDMGHPSRWNVASWWAALSRWGRCADAPLARVKQVRPKFERMCAGGFGYLTSLMALTEEIDPRRALETLLGHVEYRKGVLGMDAALRAKQRRYAGATMAAG